MHVPHHTSTTTTHDIIVYMKISSRLFTEQDINDRCDSRMDLSNEWRDSIICNVSKYVHF
mgnify:CR=1 FL=1